MHGRTIFVNSISNTEIFRPSAGLDKPSFVPKLERSKHVSWSELVNEIEELKLENSKLRGSLARKYAHNKKLKRRIAALETNIDEIMQMDCSDLEEVFDSHSGQTLITDYFSQSGQEDDPRMEVMEGMSEVKHAITSFADEDAGWTNEIDQAYDGTMDLAHNPDGELGDFLARPIRAAAYQWAVGQPFFEQFNPWATFLTNDFVKEKIANYELIRCNMHMKIVISGTPFHYGRSLVSYNPLSGFDEVTVQRNFLDIDLIMASQKPHFFLNPTHNEGGELCMPFFFRENYISLSKQDFNQFGEVSIKSFGNLLHANGGDDPVTVTVYLWATDVVLTMPTSITPASTFVSQAGKQNGRKSNGRGPRKQAGAINSGDEYGQGIISKPATAIAKAAGMLEAIPMIAPYARATEMVASKVGAIAKLFGYSRPPIVSDIQLFKPNPTGNLANVDAGDAVHKLTLDSKAEVTIDPRVTGLGPADEMGITSIATKESYLTSFTWTTGASVDDLLWQAYATPALFGIQGDELHPTPMCMLSQAFRYWQGSLKFRFQVVKSQYHKGRMLIRYDPRSHDGTINYNTNYSRVVDIAEEEDFEVIVGWGQNKPWLESQQINSSRNYYNSSLPRLATDSSGLFNGVLEVDVLNSLVSPSVDSNITVNVYVSMCDDVKFAAPDADKMRNLHVFPVPVAALDSQSGMEGQGGNGGDITDRPTGVMPIDPIGSKGEQADETMNVFFGESPTTLRELFKRYVKTRSWNPPVAGAGAINLDKLRNKNLPYHTGWDPDGVDTDFGGTTQLTCGNTHFLSFFIPCYAGYRGATRKKYVFSTTTNALTNPIVTRALFSNSGAGTYISNSIPASSDSNFLQKFFSSRFGTTSTAGASTTNLGVNNTIEVEFPFYWDGRIGYSRLLGANSLQCESHTVETIGVGADIDIQLDGTNVSYSQYDAAGEDFSLYFWTGAPILYNYSVNELSTAP